MMRKLFGFVFGLLLLVGTVVTSTATTIDFTTAVPSTTWNDGQGGTVQVGARGYASFNNSWYTATVAKNAAGLGVTVGSADSPFLDGLLSNYIDDEELVFTFSHIVTITDVGFGGTGASGKFDFFANGAQVLLDYNMAANVLLPISYTGTSFRIRATANADKYYVRSLTIADPVAPVPEPATMMLFGLGLLGLARVSRKKI